MPFNFSLLGVEWKAEAIRELVDAHEGALPPGAWPNYVLGNHDESRLASRIGKEQARLAAMLLLTLRGTPTMYYGDEIGMTDVDIPRENQKDPAGLRQPGQGRDISRTPMQWNNSPHAGFSPPSTRECWLPVADNYPEVNLEKQLEDPTSLVNLYRNLLAIRKKQPPLQTGDYHPIAESPTDCFLYLRKTEKGQILIALNFSHREKFLSLPFLEGAEMILSTILERKGPITNPLELHPREGVIIHL
jgi:alpha-glucosidase